MVIKSLTRLINFSNHRQPISLKAGKPPGSLIYTGKAKESPIKLELLKYNADNYTFNTYPDLKSAIKQIDPGYVNWLHVNNLNNTQLIEEIGNHFHIHALTLEDILNVAHLPKVEETGENLFLTLKFVRYSKEGFLSESHISLILGDHFLLTFADTDEDIFSSLKSRLESVKNKARGKKADFLFYLILDYLVDNYYLVFDEMYSRLENIENDLIEIASKNQINRIHDVKKDLVSIRKTLFPLENAIGMVLKDIYDLIDDSNEIFFRDVYDHLIQLVNTCESNREFISSLIELNSSNMNHSLNQTIKILTVITSIFIPLTFIVGIYGMNFDYMPELRTKYGYFVTMGVMGIIALFMGYLMKKKGFFN